LKKKQWQKRAGKARAKEDHQRADQRVVQRDPAKAAPVQSPSNKLIFYLTVEDSGRQIRRHI
jgi:hypothetical protein